MTIQLPVTIELTEGLTFDELDTGLKEAMRAENIATALVQAHFSTIMLTEKWKDARIWVDLDTGELHRTRQEAPCWMDPQTGTLYTDPQDAPEDTQLVSRTHRIEETESVRYRTVNDWIAELQEIPHFARSTCYRRHRLICEEMNRLGRTFEQALSSVMLSATHSEMLLRLTTDGNGFLDADRVVLLLPEPLREDVDTGDERVLREIINEKLDADNDRMLEGEDPRTVNRDLRKQLAVGADYTIALSDKHRGAFVVHRDCDGAISTYIVHIRDERDAANPVPRDVFEWVAGRLRVALNNDRAPLD
jgi:hypothetical protein